MSFTDSDIRRLVERVKESEGLRLNAYRCTAGVLTIGYGHNCQSSPVPGIKKVGDRITKEQAEVLFEQDLSACVWRVRNALPWVTELNAPRQAVLYDGAFQLGLGGLLKFKNTLAMLKAGDYEGASRGLLSSLWAKQTPGRVKRHARQLLAGEWV